LRFEASHNSNMYARAPLIVLTGPSAAGKSTVCRRVVNLARSQGLSAGGILTERRVDDGQGAGLDVVDVATDERYPLAELDRLTEGPATGRWHFHPAAFVFGLAGCGRVRPEALLVIDELGPLELVQHKGWAPLLPLLHAHIGPVLVVVRPSLVEPFLVLVQDRHPDTIEVTPAGRDALPSIILARLGLWS
jgi:nucleoside-triphosphatase THEP1